MEDRSNERASGRLGKGLIGNIASLGSAHVFTYLFPLLTVPYLTRTLGPTGWGILAFYQAFAGLAIQVIEYGFDWSATRAIARDRSSEHLSSALGAVLGAKISLSLLVVTASFGAAFLLPAMRRNPLMLIAALFWATGQASNLNWYFQGVERMRPVAILSIAGKSAAVIGVFVLVRVPDDAWLVLALNGAAAWAASAVGFIMASRGLDRVRFSAGSIRRALSEGRSFFVMQSAVGMYTLGNAFILGLFAAPRVVGYFATAEKLIRLLVSFLDPIARALYPRLSHLVVSHADRARVLVKRVTVACLALTIAVGVVSWILAPTIIRVAVGEGYEPSIPIFRLLCGLPLLIVPGYILGSQWMLPLGHESSFVKIVLAGGILNLCLALVFAPLLAAMGMALAVMMTEAAIAIAVIAWLRRNDLDPFTQAAPGLAGIS